MIPEDDTADVHLFRATQALDEVDRALARLRVALQDVDDEIQAAKERGVWSS